MTSISYGQQLHEILATLITKTNLTDTEIARRINIPLPTLHKIKNGSITDPRASTLVNIANYFKISVDQLLGKEPIYSTDQISKMIPVLNKENVINKDYELSFLNNRAYFDLWVNIEVAKNYANSEKIFGLKVNCEAMFPYFTNETIVIIDRDIVPNNRDFVLVAVKNNSMCVLRKILFDNSQVVLLSMNPIFEPIIMQENDFIIGTVIQSLNYHHHIQM